MTKFFKAFIFVTNLHIESKILLTSEAASKFANFGYVYYFKYHV